MAVSHHWHHPVKPGCSRREDRSSSITLSSPLKLCWDKVLHPYVKGVEVMTSFFWLQWFFSQGFIVEVVFRDILVKYQVFSKSYTDCSINLLVWHLLILLKEGCYIKCIIAHITPCSIACLIHVKNCFEILLQEKLLKRIPIKMYSKLCCNVSLNI